MIYHTESLWSLTNQISEVLASHTLRGTAIKKKAINPHVQYTKIIMGMK